jgi:predicted transcriptional regulator
MWKPMAYDVIRKAKSLLIRKENIERAKSFLVRTLNAEKTKAVLARKKSAEKTKSFLVRKVNAGRPSKSKLMLCIEVLCTLVSNGRPMTLTQLLDKFEMDECRLKPHLRLLWNRGLVEEENLGDNKIHYVVTERGLKVLNVISPIIREAHKIQMREFELISNTLSGAGYS